VLMLDQRAMMASSRGAASGFLETRRAGRRDTLIASAVLVLLLAGWALNFVSVKQLTLGFGSYLVYTVARQA
jgi:hypothetical protein